MADLFGHEIFCPRKVCKPPKAPAADAGSVQKIIV